MNNTSETKPQTPTSKHPKSLSDKAYIAINQSERF